MSFEEKFSVSEFSKEISNPFQGVGVSFEGKWVQFNQLMNYLSGSGFGGIKRDIASGERKYLDRFKYNLLNALITEGRSVNAPFQEHSPNYYSPTGQIGIRTSKYLYALHGLQIKSQGYRVSLTFSPGSTKQRSREGTNGTTLARYAYIFEVGNWNQPARPIWSTTFTHMGGKAKVQQYLMGAIGKRLNTILR